MFALHAAGAGKSGVSDGARIKFALRIILLVLVARGRELQLSQSQDPLQPAHWVRGHGTAGSSRARFEKVAQAVSRGSC